MDPEMMPDYYDEAMRAVAAGHLELARHLFWQAAHLNPEGADAWVWLATLARTHEERAYELSKVTSLDPQIQTAVIWLKDLLGHGVKPEAPADCSFDIDPTTAPDDPF